MRTIRGRGLRPVRRVRPEAAPPSGPLGASGTLTIAELLRRPQMWGFVATTACLEFCRGALFLSLLPAYLTDHRAGLGLPIAALGLVISAQYLADTVFKIPAGWLVDRLGPWRVLLPCLLLCAVAVDFLPRARSLPELVGLALLFGLGSAANWPAVLSGSVRLGGIEARASATSITFLAWLAGGGLGPVLINFLVGKGYGTAFGLLAIVISGAPLAAAAGLTGLLHSPLDPAVPLRPKSRRNRATAAAVWANLRDTLWLLPGMFVQMLALGIVIPVMVPFARQHLGLSQPQYGLLLMAAGTVTVLFLLPVSRLVDRTGSKGPLVAGFGLAAAAIALVATGAGAGGLLWRVGLLGLSYALILPAWNGLTVGKIDAAQRGLLLGVFMAIEGSGTAIGPAIGGALYSWDFHAPFLVTAGILLLVAAFYLVVPGRHFRARAGAGHAA